MLAKGNVSEHLEVVTSQGTFYKRAPSYSLGIEGDVVSCLYGMPKELSSFAFHSFPPSSGTLLFNDASEDWESGICEAWTIWESREMS